MDKSQKTGLAVALAIVLAGGLIAGSVLVSNRYEIVVSRDQVQRLDRWTGAVTVCAPPLTSLGTLVTISPGYNVPCTKLSDALHPAS